MKISLIQLYFIFCKIGAILLGGGYVILPIITDELSKKRNLISEDEIINYYAISQSLPGIVAANISIFSGYKLRGKAGAAAAMLGVITVPFLTIIVFAEIIQIFSKNWLLINALWGVGFAVIALITLTVVELWQKSNRDSYFYTVMVLSLITIFGFKFTPVQTVICMSCIGILLRKFLFTKGDEN